MLGTTSFVDFSIVASLNLESIIALTSSSFLIPTSIVRISSALALSIDSINFSLVTFTFPILYLGNEYKAFPAAKGPPTVPVNVSNKIFAASNFSPVTT